MKLTTLFISLCLYFFSLTVMAGTGHDHGHSHNMPPVNEEVAVANAQKVIDSLVKRKKLEQSWTKVQANSAEKVSFKGQPEWLVIFENKKIAEISRQKLHVFLSAAGEYIAVNYSGK